MSDQTQPLSYNAARKALVAVVKEYTGRECILADAKVGQPEDRPPLPYFTVKFVTPGIIYGDDDRRYETLEGGLQTKVSTGGLRGVSTSFQCFAKEQEDAWDLMARLQSALQQLGPQGALRRAGIAVWRVGTVADLTQLLNTGYEGRAQMDVLFGMAANVEEKTSVVDKVELEGTVQVGDSQVVQDFSVPPDPPEGG